jgi:hypothetical protein
VLEVRWTTTHAGPGPNLAGVGALLSTVAVAAPVPELPALTSHTPLALHSLTPNTTRLGRFAKLELTLQLAATYDNAFDPEQVEVRCVFTAPTGGAVTVNGFFFQPYQVRDGDDDAETPLLDPAGEPCWKVRFAPTEVGTYRYQVLARDRSGEVRSPEGTFEVVESGRPGFIRVSKRHPRYFEFDDGAPFFPVGQNLQNDWPVYWHSKLLADGGCNAVRAWTFCHWTWLEWTFKPGMSWAGPGHFMRSYGGAGVYNQRIAWTADHHLGQWERDGLFAMLCLGNGSELGDPDKYDSWGGHPYSVANGGWLKDGSEFWTDERTRKLYKQRLRYLVARYGYSPNVWAWEFWNELGRETDETVAWHAEMAQYLKEIDPNRHLVTTSHWGTNAEGSPRTWAVPEIDFTQTHNYAGAESIRHRTARMLASSPKPHVIGEGGGPAPGKDGSQDPDGIDFHNALWAAAMSGAAGTTLPWWWRERLEPKNLFWHYAAFARFAKTVPWTEGRLEPLPADAVRVSVPAGADPLRPVLVDPQGPDWGTKAPRDRFTVEPDGTVPHLDDFGPVLYGTGRAVWRTTPTLTVTYPAAGRFIVRVSEAAHGVLEIDLDGKLALRDDSLDVPRATVDRDFIVDVPVGQHEITLRNAGSDWLRLGHVLLTNYRDAARYPDLDVYALRSDRMAVLWFHHRLNEWAYRALGVEPTPVDTATATLTGLADGRYEVEWWDTDKGAVTATEIRPSRGGTLALTVPPTATDAACVVRREV